MAVVKKRNQQAESRLLLESDEPVELPPAEIEEGAVIVQFETFKPHVPELLEALRAGTTAEPVPVVMDGATFVVHGATRSFWVRLWHSSEEMTRIERAQIISCLPSTRGVQVIVGGEDDQLDEEDDAGPEDDYPDEEDDFPDDEPEEDEAAPTN
jgi:hypothetical protein